MKTPEDKRSSQQIRMRRAQFPLIRSKPGAEPLTTEQVVAELERMADEESKHGASFVSCKRAVSGSQN
jgi:hypothetical protein